MNKEEMQTIIKKEFGVGSVSSPFGTCTENFMNNKILEVAEKNNFPSEIIKIFKDNPVKFPKYQKLDNGNMSGKYFIGLLDK
jgi:hypothetical protein